MKNKFFVSGNRDLIFLSIVFISFFILLFPIKNLLTLFTVPLLILYNILRLDSFKLRLENYSIWIIYVLIFFLLSSLWSFSPRLSYWAIVNMVCIFSLTFSIYSYCINIDRLIQVLDTFNIVVFCFFIFLLFYFNWSDLGSERLSDTENGINGNFIATTLSYSIFAFILRSNISRKISNYQSISLYQKLLIIVYISFILLTGSRSALIMLVMPFVLYSFFKTKHKFKALIYMIFVFSLTFVITMKVPVFYDVIGSRVEDAFNVLSGNYTGGEDISRLLLFILGLEWFEMKPFLGIGINNFRVLSNVTPPFVGKNFYAHSNVIELLVDVGIIGFIIYYSYWVLVFRNIYRLKSISNALFFSLALLISLFLHDIFTVSYYDIGTQFFIAIVFIILNFEKSLYEKNSHN